MSKPVYRPDIDGLRAFAVTSVVLFHAGLPFIPSGFVGVDIFFVISGYLIGGIIFREVHNQEFRFANFYARRARRILPALVCVVSIICICGCVLLTQAELLELASSSSAALVGISNIKFFLRNDYFDSDSSLLPMLMTWSLGVEEQFYLLFPLLLLGLKRLNNAKTELVLAVISLVSFLLSIILTTTHPAAAFYLLPPRAWELGTGAILAIYNQRNKPVGSRSWNVELLSLGGLIALLMSVVLFDKDTPFPGSAAALPVVGALLLLHSSESVINRKLLSARPVVFTGLISYSWYLWHWPLMAFTRLIVIGTPPLTTMLVITAISFVIGCLSWRWIEQPFRRMQHPPRLTLMRYAAALLFTFSIIYGLKLSNGWPSRLPEAVANVEAMIKKGRGNCLVQFGATIPDASQTCIPTKGPAQAVALLGDSHASALGPGLQDVTGKLHLRFIQLSKSECTPLLNMALIDGERPTHADECGIFMANAIQRIIDDPSIVTVVLGASWQSNRAFLVTAGPEKGSRVDTITAFNEGLPPLIDRLTQSGKKVIVVEDVPEFKFDPPREAVAQAMPARLWLAKLVNPMENLSRGIASRDTMLPLNTQIDDFIRNVATGRKGVTFLNVRSQFCSDDGCRFMKNEELLYIDYGHLSTSGSKMIRWESLGTSP